MFFKKPAIVLILFGLLTFGSLSYFYFAQRYFMNNQREFLIHINNLNNYKSNLTTQVLKNSLYAYNSQDKLASDYDGVQNELQQLQNSKILNTQSYTSIKESINSVLQPQINKFLIKIQNFLLLNSAVKNSIVFLSSFIYNASYIQKKEPKLYIQSIKILDAFEETRKIQDLDYLHKIDYLLQSNSKNKKTKRFIKTFNLHTSYLIKKLPPFIQVTQNILANNVDNTLHKIKKEFNKTTLHDFAFFNRFAFVVVVVLFLYLLLALYLFMQYKKANKSLQYSLSHDTLTGVYDRSSLMKDTAENGAVIMLINIDAFKEINDVYGNNFGNRVLIKLTERLKEYFNDFSVPKVYRVGGDEFATLFINKSAKEVMKIGKILEESIKDENFQIDNIHINLSVSIAISSVAPLLENADLALKVVKKDMNRRIIEYKEELSVKKEWKKNIEVVNMVKSALKEDRIVPYFQGIVNLQNMKIEKYESLVRLILPSGEVLSPYAFLDVVSKTHYYYDITKVMIQKSIEVAKVHPQQRFSINFSMKDIINENIINTLFKLFDADRETAKRIDIELLETEMVAVEDKRISKFIQKVHSYGSKILIDDFGTGYSNFAYLSDLDVDILKIDASIIKEITSDPKKLHITRSIHNFTLGMNMQNVAEFVETKETALLLKEIGIEYAQGYLFCKPQATPQLENSVTL